MILLRTWLGLVCWALVARAESGMERALLALQQGDLAGAEAALRAELQARPNDAQALGVLGIVLDREKNFEEAERAYLRAIGFSPRTPGLLNNYGNHLVATGQLSKARTVFLKVLALNPAQVNATVQLARIELQQGAHAAALQRLEQLPAGAQKSTDVQMLLGLALSAAKQFGKAEQSFSNALESSPGNFDILYNLGLAASHAGHNQRALQVLQVALGMRPDSVEVLYDLAAVELASGKQEAAVDSLSKAARLAPDRAEVQLLLARATSDLGYFGDSVSAWDRYVELAPKDDTARRERAVGESILGQQEKSVADLRWFLERHPDDPVAHYYLGMVESPEDPVEALAQFNRALVLKPGFASAYLGRAALRYREGNPAAALPDLESAARYEPDNPAVQDRLGQAYMALGRTAGGIRALRKASSLAPGNAQITLHLAHALMKAGDTEAANTVMARMGALGPGQAVLPRPAGLVDFLSLSPEEQYAQFRAGVTRTVQNHPENVEAQVQYLKICLNDGNMSEAPSVSKRLLALHAPGKSLAEAAGALLGAKQYSLAKSFLEEAVAQAGSDAELRLDLAIATSHAGDPAAALEQMDRIAEARRTADYYLERAEILEELGKRGESGASLKKALDMSPVRPELYRRSAVFLLRIQRAAEALEILNQGTTALPKDRGLLLAKAVTLGLTGNAGEGERQLKSLENRWPEWRDLWLAHGLVLKMQNHPADALLPLKTAATLGAQALPEAADPAAALLDLLVTAH